MEEERVSIHSDEDVTNETKILNTNDSTQISVEKSQEVISENFIMPNQNFSDDERHLNENEERTKDTSHVDEIGLEESSTTMLNQKIVNSNNLSKNSAFDCEKEDGKINTDILNNIDNRDLYIPLSQSPLNVIQNHTNAVLVNTNDNDNSKVNTFSENDIKKEIHNDSDIRSSQSVSHHISNIPVRPTLADDSKLVKISLSSNPINLMQSNAHFLNKSLNFFNYITEKSTNIMEKALIPHHLAGKYNNVALKSCESIVLNKEPNSQQSQNCNKITVDKDNISNSNSESNSLNDTIEIFNAENILEFDKNCEVKKSENLENSISECQGSNTKENCVQSNITIPPNVENESNHSDLNLNSITNLDASAYMTLLRDYSSLKTRNEKLVEQLESFKAYKGDESVSNQITELQETVDRLTNELRLTLTTQDNLKKECTAANKERESMVMKYAVSEKQLIDMQRLKDNAERKMKDAIKDQEFLQTKLKQTLGERTRVCGILNTKCKEVEDLQQEVNSLKNEVNMKDVKLKWAQNKLKTEMDAQKETQQKLTKALTRINDMKEECEQVRREAQESITRFQQSEENKAVTLDQQLKEQQARLILERHVTEDKEALRLQLQKEVDTLKQRQQALIEENNTLSLKNQELEKDRLSYESSFSALKIIADQRHKEISELLAKVSELEMIKLQLQHKEQCLASAEAEIKNLQQSNEDLLNDMNACRQREADMLDFTQKLTDKNVRLQSEFTAIEHRMKSLEEERGPLRARIVELTRTIKSLEESLADERKAHSEECEILATHLAEQTQLSQSLSRKLEDIEGENAVLKRKQQASMKEMTRELQQYRKKLETLEAASPSNSLHDASRADSSTSLNADVVNGTFSDASTNGDQVLEPSRQVLIDRIIKLQKINVRRAEKLDFLEEHTRTLVAELQKKTKIIQNYILHENFDAMGSNERDRHKAELARHGGIMASVYNQKVSDDHMTLELSLEINQKLQAVLEDALLKNITLKDNIDTLGEEIARLTMQNQRQLSS